MITRQFAFATSTYTRYNVFCDGTYIGYDDVPISPDVPPQMQVVFSAVRTAVTISLGGGSTDIAVTWRNSAGVATPFTNLDYKIYIADLLTSGVAATVVTGSKTLTGCTIRVTSTGLLSLGTLIYAVAYGTI